MFNRFLSARRSVAVALTGLAFAAAPAAADAQYPYYGPSATQRPGGYLPVAPGVGYNPVTGSHHVPGQAVVKPSGVYTPIGGGYYQNPLTGNKYNPYTGSYLQGTGNYGGGSTVEQRPGFYLRGANGVGYNPATGSTHIPGQAVVKPSGVYTPIGNGYYRNPYTGNVYNPATGKYIRN